MGEPGVRVFAGTQLGAESTAGTPVAATIRYTNPVAFPVDDSPLVYPPQDVAISGGTDRSHRPFKKASITFPKGVPTFQQAPLFFEMGVKAVGTGAADGSGSGKVYAYPLPTTGPNSIKSFTVEAFDDYQEYESEYVVGTEISFTGKVNEAWQMETKAIGRQVTPSTKTGALSLPTTISDILFQNTKLYIDAIGGTLGATVKANTFLGFEWKLFTGWKDNPTGDGNLYWTAAKYIGYKLTGKLMLEHNAIGKAQFDAYQASTPQLFRIRALGNALSMAGTTYSYETASLDFPAKYTKCSELKDEAGNDIFELEWESKYNVTAALAANTIFVNESASLYS